jgi:hypothetical protein
MLVHCVVVQCMMCMMGGSQVPSTVQKVASHKSAIPQHDIIYYSLILIRIELTVFQLEFGFHLPCLELTKLLLRGGLDRLVDEIQVASEESDNSNSNKSEKDKQYIDLDHCLH